ncbi:MAG: hypothetical protein ABSE17_04075 [Candidatus Levyibacteriota bacterium]|jgi:hypothetical protein
MATPARNLPSTQKFIEIENIVDDVVISPGGNACLVIEVSATNFALLSPEEQDAKIYAYASLLNSLSFPIQIVIRSKKLDITNYLKLLDVEKDKTPNAALAKQIGLYRDFVKELVKVNTVLDKKFYIVIPYSALEKGASGARATFQTGSGKDNFVVGASAALHSKAESIHTQLRRLNLKARTLDEEQLTKLYYEIFNDNAIDHASTTQTINPIALGKETK